MAKRTTKKAARVKPTNAWSLVNDEGELWFEAWPTRKDAALATPGSVHKPIPVLIVPDDGSYIVKRKEARRGK